MGELGIELCGRPAVVVDGVRTEVTRPKEQLLLAFLVLERDRVVRRDELLDLLWPEAPPDDPGAALATVLSRVRRVLRPGQVEGRGELRTVLPDAAWVDVERDDATDLDAFLPGLEGPWVDARREALAGRRLAVLEARARAALAAGDLPRAQAAADALVDAAPFRESAAAVRIEVLRARGDHAEALLEFDRVRVLLREELGVAPGPELQAQHGRLLAGEAAPGPPGRTPLPDPLAAAARAPLAGRGAEVAALAAAGPVAVVAGEPGIGKTRLAAEVAARAHEAGAAVLYGRCEEDPLAPYGPFREALRRHVLATPAGTLARQAGEGAADLSRLVPELGGRLGDVPARAAGDAEAERFRLFEAVGDLLARVAAVGGAVLVIEDLHWADASTLALLRHLGRLRPPGLRLLLTFRPTETGERLTAALAALRREGPLDRLDLDGLDAGAVGELMGALADAPAPEGLASAVVDRTDGNPFFIGEVLRQAAELAPRDVAWPTPAALEAAGVPSAVQDVLADRIGRLTRDGRALLATAAVAGREFDEDVLAAAAGADPDAVLDELELAVQRGLLAEVPGCAGRFAFTHALVRQALDAQLGAARRVRTHARVAAALEQVRPGAVEALALHWRGAAAGGDRAAAEAAWRASERAGDAAAAVFSNPEALEHLTAALELAGEAPAEDQARLAAKAGELARRLGRVEEAIGLWRRALAGTADGETAARLHARIGDALTERDEGAVALEEYRAAIERLPAGRPTPTLVRVYAQSAWAYLDLGQDMLAVYAAEKAVQTAEAVGEPSAASRAHAVFGRVHSRVGDPARAVASLGRALALARDAGPDEEVRALRMLGDHLHDADTDPSAARDVRLRALAIAERTGDLPAQLDLRAALAAAAWREGDRAALASHERAARALAARVEIEGREALPRLLEALRRWHEGDGAAGRAGAAAAAARAVAADWSGLAAWALVVEARMALEDGDPEAVLAAARGALAHASRAGLAEQEAHARLHEVLALRALGRRAEADEAAAALADRAARVRAPAATLCAREAAAADDAECAAVLDGWRALGRPLDAARVQARLGGAVAQDGGLRDRR